MMPWCGALNSARIIAEDAAPAQLRQPAEGARGGARRRNGRPGELWPDAPCRSRLRKPTHEWPVAPEPAADRGHGGIMSGRFRFPLTARWAILLLIVAVPLGCSQRVTRIDPAAVTDLSGRWNDTDSRLVANELITSSLTEPWLRRHTEASGGQAPVVIVGDFRNRTMEHIPVNTFVRDLERAYVNAGVVRVVASADERSEVRDERRDQQENARADTRVRMAQETGARYMLQGNIEAIEDREGRERVIFYQVDATLVDLQTNERVWVGQHKIKKVVTQPRLRR
jgi:penicillin-binding protein activator